MPLKACAPTPRLRVAGLLTLAAALVVAGCVMVKLEPPVEPVMVWPQPPEILRIALINIVHGPEDLGIRAGVFRRLWRGLTGHNAPSIQSPHGLTTDRAGRLYVVDKVLRQVHIFDQQGQRYQLIPAANERLQSPIDVAVDERRGRIFVSDAGDSAVRIFNLDGTAAGEIRRGLLGRPTGLSINGASDELLVIDSEHAALLRFALDDLRPLGVIGRLGEKDGQFNAPTAVTVGPNGAIYVIDTLNHRVQVLTAEGHFVNAFGSAGDAPGYFSRPKAVAVDRQGNIHVVDALFDNVQVFNSDGTLLMAYAEPGSAPGQLWLPAGITIDDRGRIYLADTYNRRVQIFQFLEEGELPE